MAEERWSRLDGHELLPLVRGGVNLTDGEKIERDDQPEYERAAD